MRNIVETLVTGYQMYQVQNPQYYTEDPIPFRVSEHPLELSSNQSDELKRIGKDIGNYVAAIDELYRADGRLRSILDKGKPELFLAQTPIEYVFYRPDLIITASGFSICEVETSPFGLAIAHLLNKAALHKGAETLVGENILEQQVIEATPQTGVIVYTDRTQAYSGQIAYLADKVFTTAAGDRKWQARHIQDISEGENETIYRSFYLAEYENDPSVKSLLDRWGGGLMKILPSLTPHLEEKAILAVIWDKRWENLLRKRLGEAVFQHLRQVIPKTFIVGEEAYFSPGLPNDVDTAVDLANLSRSKRTLVLKTSGYSRIASWGRGVTFLHKKSKVAAEQLLRQAYQEENRLSVIQDFCPAIKIPMSYKDRETGRTTLAVRVRLTPYFSFNEGRLIAIKATGCANTEYVHTSTASINAAVA